MESVRVRLDLLLKGVLRRVDHGSRALLSPFTGLLGRSDRTVVVVGVGRGGG